MIKYIRSLYEAWLAKKEAKIPNYLGYKNKKKRKKE